MAVRIRLAKTGEQVETRELLLPQDLVSIGRDAASILPLADPLVSKAHARIERNGGSYSITDLHSTNATFLNGEKLTPDRPYPLAPGDRVRIAGFELELLAADAPPPAPGSAPSGQEKPPGTNGQFSRYLEEWFVLRSQVVKDLENFDLRKISSSHDQLLRRCEELAEENQKLRSRLAKESAPSPVEAPPRPLAPPPPSWGLPASPVAGRAAQTILALLDFLTRLSSGQASFLSEFVMRTTFQTGVGVPGRFQSGEEAMRYFADPSLNDEEFASRQSELQTLSGLLILHVMGLLEGYRKSVDDGARRLLAQFDPEPIRQELSDPNKTSGPRHAAYRMFPALLDLEIYRRIAQRLQDLKHEDRGVLEKRYFRPGFIHGYEGRVASSNRGTATGD